MVNLTVYLDIYLDNDQTGRGRLLQRWDIADSKVTKILDGIYDNISIVAENQKNMILLPELKEEGDREVLIFNEVSLEEVGKLVGFMYEYFEDDLAVDTWLGADLHANDYETVSPHIYKTVIM